jgi:hypothetical protein
MIVLLLFVMGLLFMLSSFKFQTVLTNLIANRLGATSPAIYESIEGALDLGLGLGSVIAWVQQNNPGIRSIDIFNIQGKILYSTEKQRVEQAAAPHILENLKTASGHYAQVELDATFLCAFKLLNNYNQRVGGGAILYSKDDYSAQVIKFNNSLLLKSSIIFIAFALLASIGIMVAFRGLRNYLKSIEASHDQIRDSEVTGQNICFIDINGLPAGASENASIRMDAFDDRLCAIERNLANATEALDTLEIPEPDTIYDENQTGNDTPYDQQSDSASRMARPLIFIMMGTLFLASIVFAYISFTEFTRFLEPELKKKAQLISLNIDQDLTKAVDVGIPFDELVGVGEYLDLIATEFDEVTYLEVQGPAGQTRFHSGQTKSIVSNLNTPKQLPDADSRLNAAADRSKSIIYSYPIKVGEKNSGTINVGIDEDFVRSQLDSIVYDNMVIFIVAVLIAFQIMTALFLYYVTGPIERLNLLISIQARGNFSQYIKTRGGDSIGKVARYLSQSARDLNAHFRERRDQLKTASVDVLRRLDSIGRQTVWPVSN